MYQEWIIRHVVELESLDAELTDDMKLILDDRLQEDEGTYLSADESIQRLQKEYGI